MPSPTALDLKLNGCNLPYLHFFLLNVGGKKEREIEREIFVFNS